MTVFDFSSTVGFLRQYLDQQPNHGHGVLSRWARSLKVSNALLSQVMRGQKILSLEIADGIAELLDLDDRETDFLLLLVEAERAGTQRLKRHFQKKIEVEKEKSRLLKNRLKETSALSIDIKAQYYSSWLYTAIRNLAVCADQSSVETLAARLNLPRPVVLEIIDFLLQHSLLDEHSGHWTTGINTTYLASDSPLISKHHQNWRLKSLQQVDLRKQEDLFYTSPMSLSLVASRDIRKEIVEFTQQVQRLVGPSNSEVVRCLNIDWFEY